MTGEGRRRSLVRVLAWLLTPVVAWAASFLGGWLGAVIGVGASGPRGLVWLGAGALIGGVAGVVVWVVLLRRWTRPNLATPSPAPQGERK